MIKQEIDRELWKEKKRWQIKWEEDGESVAREVQHRGRQRKRDWDSLSNPL